VSDEDKHHASTPSATRKLLDMEEPLRDAFAAVRLLDYVQLGDFSVSESDMISGFLRRAASSNLARVVAIVDPESTPSPALPKANHAE